jgi:hypothetical protein
MISHRVMKHETIGQIEFCTKIHTSFDDIVSATNFKLKFGFADHQFILKYVTVVKEEIYDVAVNTWRIEKYFDS